MSIKSRLIGSSVSIALATGLVANFEGLRQYAYLDPVGIPTICYGSTSRVHLGQYKSKEECQKLLETELKIYADAVHKVVKVPMAHPREAALISFTYNVGIENFRRSTLLKKLNAGDTIGACNELPKWVYARGVKLPGLVKRREKERELCLIF
ncbi:lysozyme [Dyadobacter sp. CY261]|uniref:lysozyme n=1 Tax=Dyadobacter sp. CY261 TaxID=2907203 RepID=UPI001F173E86|nr:lysozyme [Dyadobacter sp. CY261]MCF0075434.1 lysozyme [Dyadobacter sp. CY261]